MDLVVETALPGVRIGLFGPGVSTQLVLPEARGEQLSELLDVLLEKSSVSLSAVRRVVASTGPGSFTGLRAGLAFCEGLCFSGRRTLHGASTLRFLRSCATNSAEAWVLLPARSDAYYVAWPDGREAMVETAALLDSLGSLTPLACFGNAYALPSSCEALEPRLDLANYAGLLPSLAAQAALAANYLQEFRVHRKA